MTIDPEASERGEEEALAALEELCETATHPELWELRLAKEIPPESDIALIATSRQAIPALIKLVRDLQAQIPRNRFPVQGGPSVPWEFVAPHERQAIVNHEQTLRRLAQRGGLSPKELWCVVHSKRWRDGCSDKEALKWLRGVVARRTWEEERADTIEALKVVAYRRGAVHPNEIIHALTAGEHEGAASREGE